MAVVERTNEDRRNYWVARAHEAASRGQVAATKQHLATAEEYATVDAETRREKIAYAERMAKYIERDKRFSFGGA